MRVAVLGTRKSGPEMEQLILDALPDNTTELVTYGPLCTVTARVAKRLGLYLTKFFPNTTEYSEEEATKICLDEVLDYADFITLFWDGKTASARNLVLRCTFGDKPLRYT